MPEERRAIRRTGARRGAVVHRPVVLRDGTVEHPHVEIEQAVAERRAQEILDAERARHVSQQPFAARFDRRRHAPVAVDGHVHDETGEGTVVDDERDLARDRHVAGVPRARHRLAPHRLGVHVEPERLHVLAHERLDEGDGRHGRHVIAGPDAVVRMTEPALLALELRGAAGRDDRHPQEGLHAGEALRDLEPRVIRGPRLPVDDRSGQHEPGRAPEDLRVGVEPLVEPRADILHGAREACPRAEFGLLADFAPDEEGEHEPEDCHDHGGDRGEPPFGGGASRGRIAEMGWALHDGVIGRNARNRSAGQAPCGPVSAR